MITRQQMRSGSGSGESAGGSKGSSGWLKSRDRVFPVILCAAALIALGVLYLERAGDWGYDPAQVVLAAQTDAAALHPLLKGRERWSVRPYSNGEGTVFQKTHKTASSTLTSVLWRNLCSGPHRRNCFLPPADTPGRSWDLGHAKDWAAVREGASTVPGQGFPYDVWVHHVRWHPRLLQAISGATRVVSIVRDPAQRFASAWQWYEHEKNVGMDLPTFARTYPDDSHGVLSSPAAAWSHLRGTFPAFRYRSGLDATTEELTGISGFRSASRHQQEEAFSALVRRVQLGQLVLLVADRFDESLLVLGKMQNWSHRQLLYSRLKTQMKPEIGADVEQRLRELQPWDSALFGLAKHGLDRHVASLFGSRESFDEELLQFRQQVEETGKMCDGDEPSQKKIDREFCADLQRDNNAAVTMAWDERGHG